MDRKYTCYCGLYCENCAVKAKVEPAAKVLFEEMKKAGFEEVIGYIPGGETDPNYVVVKLTTKRISLWVDFEIAAATL